MNWSDFLFGFACGIGVLSMTGLVMLIASLHRD